MIRAISLQQPLADAVAAGEVSMFTKPWRTPYRGLIAVHAPDAPTGDRPRRAIVAVAGLAVVAAFDDVTWKRDPDPFEVLGLNKVGPLAVADRTALWRLEGAPERWLYVLTDVRRLDRPVECTGRGSGAWALPTAAVEDSALRAALR